MGMPPVLNFDELTAPIAENPPAGINLRTDSSPNSLWLQIKDARAKARAAEKEALNSGGDPRRAGDWKPSIKLIQQALASKTKDLDLAAWLLEALTLESGFRGVADAYRLAAELIEKYWDAIYPPVEEEGSAGRVFQFAGLNGDGRPGLLVSRIYNIPLTAKGSVGPFDYTDYQQAVELEKVADPEKRQARIDRGGITLEQFTIAVTESGPEFYQLLRDDMADADAQLTRFETILKEKAAGAEIDPPTLYVREAIANCRKTVEALSPSPDAAVAAPAAQSGTAAAPGSAPGAKVATAATGAITSRADAFARIQEVAAYFRQTEPQSPVSYALEQAIRWGKMPLPELLSELITDDAPRKDLFRLVGLPKLEEKPQG